METGARRHAGKHQGDAAEEEREDHGSGANRAMLGASPVADLYLMPTTIESGPTRGSTRVDEKPAAFIQPTQSAPV